MRGTEVFSESDIKLFSLDISISEEALVQLGLPTLSLITSRYQNLLIVLDQLSSSLLDQPKL
jgi:hypothetical protein